MTRLSKNFTLEEFVRTSVGSPNNPTPQDIVHMTYGCLNVLQPLRDALGVPIIINSGFRTEAVNAAVGGVQFSQHLTGCAADIRPAKPAVFASMVLWLRQCPYVDQLLTGSGWLHVSWTPFGVPRQYIRIGYYH